MLPFAVLEADISPKVSASKLTALSSKAEFFLLIFIHVR